MNIGIANVSQVDGLWPLIADQIQKGCDRTGGATSSAELWKLCRSGQAYLVIASTDEIKMASVWRFEDWPSGMVFRCLALGGVDMASWLIQSATFIHEQAQIGGAQRLITQGRKGWERVFKRMYRQSRVLWQTYEVKINAR